MDLDGTADALYALPRADFTPARDERVKEARSAGDKALAASIGKLRRPTVAAWLVNNLARQRPDEITGLAELGEQLRAAHEQLDGAALRRLSEQRRELINALTRTTRELGAVAGEEVSESVSRELEGMFTSALTDPDAARALASGRLSSPKELASASTLDWPAIAPGAHPQPAPPAAPADVAPGTEAAPRAASAAGSRTGAASRTGAGSRTGAASGAGAADSGTDTDSGAGAAPAGPPPRPADRPNPALARARQELERLTEALSEARAGAEAAHRDYDEAAAEEAAAHQAVADRRAELIAAEQAEQRARQRARAARRDREDTDRALRDADRRHGVARDRLTALEH
ncbi:MAG: hypothetical protein QOC75_2989 [Pseudonocardiales bacterium]|nr:hypothetical protein [Pseudonocardiales bacterium]